MNTLLTILQWAIPSGGIGAAIAWIANRKVQKVKATKEVHDTFKSMYDDVSRLLEETQKKYEKTSKQLEELTSENARTRRALNRLSRAIEAIQVCPYREKCPVSGELSLDGSADDELQHGAQGDGDIDTRGVRHDHRVSNGDDTSVQRGTCGHCENGDTAVQSDHTAV